MTSLTREQRQIETEAGYAKLFERPFMQELLAGAEVTMEQVRDFMVDFLAGYETFSICSNCPEYSGPRKKKGCCDGCALHDVEVGCTLRTTACLTASCPSLEKRFKKRGAETEFQALRGIFYGLDIIREGQRVPDETLLVLTEDPNSTSVFRFRVNPIEGPAWLVRESIHIESSRVEEARRTAFVSF